MRSGDKTESVRTPRSWLTDIAFYVVAFVALSAIILVVNLATNTARGLSGNALATVLAGLMLLRYRWHSSVPGLPTILAISPFGGLSAVLFLFMLQWVVLFNTSYSFEPASGYELLAAFLLNWAVLAATLLIRRRGGRASA
ncbi:hypothetical protein [Marinobacter sp.]|uniref:hypothetical protein n=1 Tax=Marinobacter sp. TaxID=50741 RepID=UPI00384A96AB